MQNTEGLPIATAEPKREKTTRAAGIGGSAVEALAGLTAVVLSILGLAGKLVIPFAAIAVIAAGAALLFEAAALAARDATQAEGEDETERAAVKGGIGADTIAGIAAIALGVLSLLGMNPTTLLPVAAIVLGAGLLLSSGAPVAPSERRWSRRGASEPQSLAAASGVHVLVGAAALVLGIVGVLGTSPLMMTLIATLSIGAAQLLSGAAIGGRMSMMLRHGT